MDRKYEQAVEQLLAGKYIKEVNEDGRNTYTEGENFYNPPAFLTNEQSLIMATIAAKTMFDLLGDLVVDEKRAILSQIIKSYGSLKKTTRNPEEFIGYFTFAASSALKGQA